MPSLRIGELSIYGSKKQIEEARILLKDVDTNLSESKIRLNIQQLIDKEKIKAEILFDGNTVYPFDKIVKEYKRLKKSGKLEKMSNRFYDFLMNGCDDIAHYNKFGYIQHYNNDFTAVQREIINKAIPPHWHSDLIRILKAIKE